MDLVLVSGLFCCGIDDLLSFASHLVWLLEEVSPSRIWDEWFVDVCIVMYDNQVLPSALHTILCCLVLWSKRMGWNRIRNHQWMPCLNVSDLESCIDTVTCWQMCLCSFTYFHKLPQIFMIFYITCRMKHSY